LVLQIWGLRLGPAEVAGVAATAAARSAAAIAIFFTVPPSCVAWRFNSKLSAMSFDPVSDYPLGSRRPDLVRTPSGLGLADLTLDAVRAGKLGAEDLRAAPETLRRQSAVALAAGRTQLADNLARAAELSTVPSETILEIYTALRPHRSTAEELEAMADRLETELGSPLSAAFVREALSAYAARGLLDTGDRAPV
jgi:propanediol dehydratase small subunit